MSDNIFSVYNGLILSNTDIAIPPDSRGFKYGDGFFETMKMINGKLVFEDYHFERLFSSLQTLQFDTPLFLTKDYLLQKIYELAGKNGHQLSARIRLTIFRGEGYLYDDNNEPNYIIQSQALSGLPEYDSDGLSVSIYTDARKAYDKFSAVKNNNYLPYAMAAIWCRKKGFDDALIMNSENRIAEATTSNLFIIKGGMIKTPPISEGCIEGVTRRYLLECFKKESIAHTQEAITEQNVMMADEMFLTNSGFYIRWIKQCGTKFYTNKLSKDLYQKFIKSIIERK